MKGKEIASLIDTFTKLYLARGLTETLASWSALRLVSESHEKYGDGALYLLMKEAENERRAGLRVA